MNKKMQLKGFTIIEVILVLAIAALIILMVFIAWPALQRSQRDQQRLQDVGLISSVVGTFKSNNRGTLPTLAQLRAQMANQATNIYDPATSLIGGTIAGTNITTNPNTAGSTDGLRAGNLINIVYVVSAACGADGAVVAAGARQAALIFQVEGSGNPTPRCEQV